MHVLVYIMCIVLYCMHILVYIVCTSIMLYCMYMLVYILYAVSVSQYSIIPG
jgi:hypothetical protein